MSYTPDEIRRNTKRGFAVIAWGKDVSICPDCKRKNGIVNQYCQKHQTQLDEMKKGDKVK